MNDMLGKTLLRLIYCSIFATCTLLAPTLASATIYSLPANSTQMVVADFNGDKKPDVVVIQSNGSISVLLNNGEGTFGAATQVNLPLILPDNIVAADFNGDGKLDVAIGGYDPSTGKHIIQILQGNGHGAFKQLAPFPTACLYFFPFVAGDFNNDLKQDLMCYGEFIPGKGNGKFGPEVSGGMSQGGVDGDFNSDGFLDLIVGLGQIYLEVGNGDGTFKPEQKVLHAPGGVTSSAVGDFNADKKLDLALASYSSGTKETTVSILLGQGDGTFKRGSSIAAFSGTSQSHVMVADYNGDGFPDVVLLPYVFLNNGKGKLASPTYTGLIAGPYGEAAVDLNGDGKADVMAIQQGSGGAMQLQVILTP